MIATLPTVTCHANDGGPSLKGDDCGVDLRNETAAAGDCFESIAHNHQD
jgi:hypothetical protein